MTLYSIPLAALPAQVLAVTLGDQPCRIDVYQKTTGLFVDLYVADVPIAVGVLALDRDAIVRDRYLGFVGELAFVDTQGTADPYYAGLADRFVLTWDDSAA